MLSTRDKRLVGLIVRIAAEGNWLDVVNFLADCRGIRGEWLRWSVEQLGFEEVGERLANGLRDVSAKWDKRNEDDVTRV
jgi:hypothetical protein